MLMLVALFSGITILRADSVTMKNGLFIEGKPVPVQGLTKKIIKQKAGPTTIYSLLMVHTGMKRYFMGGKLAASVDPSAILSRYETFKLPQRKSGRKFTITSLGSFANVTKFDNYGSRTVSIQTKRGLQPIVQGVTSIDPKHLTVVGLTHAWEHGIATTSVPPDNLDAMLRQVTDQSNPLDRMAIARFYMQAGMYTQSARELNSIKQSFPELKEKIEEIDSALRESHAKQLLQELRRRVKSGQHQLSFRAAKLFPTKNMQAGVLREVNDLIQNYKQRTDNLERAKSLLAEYQAEITDENVQKQVAAIRTEVTEHLDLESMKHLESFLNLAGDQTLKPEEKLALAYSGWVIGSPNAQTDLSKALHLWDARFLMLNYLQTNDPQEQQRILQQLKKVEGVGAATVAQLIPYLPALKETPNLEPGVAHRITIPKTATHAELTYHVLLPPEYSPHHNYPTILALHPAERNALSEMKWWGGTKATPLQSQRRGYIVITPEYLNDNQKSYDYSAAIHARVLACLRDAKDRLMIDSSRVFLAGHGLGGDAAIDMGMSHPDLFAGVISVCGMFKHYSKWYWQNAKLLPMFIVAGELDRNSLEQNGRDLNRMMTRKYDVLYCEYIGRGYESYYAEIHKLFDWMDFHKRADDPTEVEASILRPGDNHFYWVEVSGLPQSVLRSDVLANGKAGRISPMKLKARISPGNTVNITSGAAENIIWLNKKIIDFNKRVTVRHRGRSRFKDFIEESIATMLEDFQLRGDRQKIYSVKIVID